MFKFNGGAGAIICDACRRILKEPAVEGDKAGFPNQMKVDVCNPLCYMVYTSPPHCEDCGIETEAGPSSYRCEECWIMRIPGL